MVQLPGAGSPRRSQVTQIARHKIATVAEHSNRGQTTLERSYYVNLLQLISALSNFYGSPNCSEHWIRITRLHHTSVHIRRRPELHLWSKSLPKTVLSVEMHTGVERPLLPVHDRQSCDIVVTAAVILISVVGAWFRNKRDDLLPDPTSMTEIRCILWAKVQKSYCSPHIPMIDTATPPSPAKPAADITSKAASDFELCQLQ